MGTAAEVSDLTFAEKFTIARDSAKGTGADPADAAGIVIGSGANRVVIDLMCHSFGTPTGDVTTDVLDPGGGADSLTQIADARVTTATTAEIWAHLEAGLSAAGSYTLRADLGGAMDLFREVIVLENARQALSTGVNTVQTAAVLTVTANRSGGGDFPIGSKIYAVAINSDEHSFAVTGDAIRVRQDLLGWQGTNGYCYAKGTLTTVKASVSVTFTLPVAANRFAAALVVVEPAGDAVIIQLQPVTVVGDRLYSAGSPYFPTTNFLWDSSDAEFSHTYFSEEIDDGKRHRLYNLIKNIGFNSIYIYTMNDGDYGSLSVSPFVSGFSGAFDTAKLAWWREHLEMMIADGIRPILWLAADNSPPIDTMSEANFNAYVTRMVQEFDDLPILWCLGLEVNEYWTSAEVQARGNHLASEASNPVGPHQTIGLTSFMNQSWVQVGYYQVDGGLTPEQQYDSVMTARANIGNKPLIFSEYSQGNEGGNNTLTQQKGLAGSFAWAAGFGNGGPPALGAFMESLPDNMDASRIGDVLTLTGGGVIATADISALTFEKEVEEQPPAELTKTLTAHFRFVADAPANLAAAVTQARAGLALAGIELVIQSEESLDADAYLNIDVNTAADEELYLLGLNGVSDRETVVYFINTITEGATPFNGWGLIGARPIGQHQSSTRSLVAAAASDYILGHELLHNLGLEHSVDTNNWMYPVTTDFTNLPPDLTAPQITTARSSALLNGAVLRAVSNGETTDDVASIALPHPAGTSVGDLLHAIVCSHRANGVAPHAHSQGWTHLHSMKSTNYHVSVYRRIATSGDVTRGNSTFSIPENGTNSHFWGIVLAWEAGTFDPAAPEDALTVRGNGTGTTAAVAPAVTTVSGNATVVYIMSTDIRLISGTPAGTTVAHTYKHTESLGGTAAAYYKNQTTAGASGTGDFTLNANGEWVGFTLAIKPVPEA
jgi:hypothetical protein